MEYSSVPAVHWLSPTPLTFTAYPALKDPGDMQWGYQNQRWFTAAGAIGRLNGDGTVSKFPVPGGGSPMYLSRAAGGKGGFWFTLPQKNAIGRIFADGTFGPLIDCGKNSRPAAITGDPYRSYAAAFGRPEIYELTGDDEVREIGTDLYSVEALADATGGDWLWCFAKGELVRISTEDGRRGNHYTLPEGAAVERMIRHPSGEVFYVDIGRRVIGRIKDEFTLVEYRLQPGMTPLDICAGGGSTVWFPVSGRPSICRMEDDGVLEYPLSGAADFHLHRIMFDLENLWCSESAGKRIGYAKAP